MGHGAFKEQVTYCCFALRCYPLAARDLLLRRHCQVASVLRAV